MQRVDAGYIYDLGDAVRCLKSFRLREVQAYEIWQPLRDCRQKLTAFLSNSVYSRSIRGVLRSYTQDFITTIDSLAQRIVKEQLESVSLMDQAPLHDAYDRFEPVFSAELSSQVLYLVTPKGAYDIVALVDQGAQLFPASVAWKVPEAVKDIEEGAKALAFELWSASAFHFHRANEAVLRRYYDLCCGANNRPRNCTMGTMLKKLEDEQKGDSQIVASLKNINDFHRNPNSHPGHFIDDSEQAFSLVAALRAAMGYMLEALPFDSFDALMASTPNPEVNAPPLL